MPNGSVWLRRPTLPGAKRVWRIPHGLEVAREDNLAVKYGLASFRSRQVGDMELHKVQSSQGGKTSVWNLYMDSNSAEPLRQGSRIKAQVGKTLCMRASRGTRRIRYVIIPNFLSNTLKLHALVMLVRLVRLKRRMCWWVDARQYELACGMGEKFG